MQPQDSLDETQDSSNKKVVVALLFLSTFINYLDRQTLSIVAPLLRNQFSLSSVGYSRIVFAFLLGYTISQALAGKVIDRVGTRFGMLLFVAIWSATAMLHGAAVGFLSFCAVRLLLGLAEAGNWPGAVKAVSENFAAKNRALAVGVFNSGSSLGAIIAPPVVVGLVHMWGWRSMFGVVGATGFVWMWFWGRLYRAGGFQQVSSTATENLRRAPLLAYLKQRSVWALMIGRFLADPVWWFYAFWLPEYLVRTRGFDMDEIGRTLWIPFVLSALGNYLGGFASGKLVLRGVSPSRARNLVMVMGALLMLLGVPAFQVRSNAAAMAWISLVLFGYSCWASNILSLPADLFAPEEVARVTGLSGTGGAIGGMLFTLVTGWIVQNISYGPVFALASAMIICGAGAVTLLLPRTRPDQFAPAAAPK